MPQVGKSLIATDGIWTNSPVTFTYQWKSAGVNATGPGTATNSYTPVIADIGNTLTISVIANNSFGSSSSAATSAATSAVVAANNATPIILTAP